MGGFWRIWKKESENRRENEWEDCLVGRGRGREKWKGPTIFSLSSPKFNLLKMGENWREKGERVCWTKLPFPTYQLTFHFVFCCFSISSCLHSMFTLVLFFVFFFFFGCSSQIFCLSFFFFFWDPFGIFLIL